MKRKTSIVVIALALVLAPTLHAFARGMACPMTHVTAQPVADAATSSEVGRATVMGACALHCMAIAVLVTLEPAQTTGHYQPLAEPWPQGVSQVFALDPAPPRTARIA